jgi:hypothetical protein
MTPIIAGSVCGAVMGLAYIIGFTIYIVKRRRRKQRAAKMAASGTPPLLPPQKKRSKSEEQHVVIPPDPAIVLGLRRPGEKAFDESPNPSNPSPHTEPRTSSDVLVITSTSNFPSKQNDTIT